MWDRRRFLHGAALTLTGAPFAALANQGGAQPTREVRALDAAADWINSPRLRASSLAGKVVLVDFCTYTCINWLRALPYRRAWSRKYTEGLVVVGVHTPEFGFEHDVDNVRRAVRQLNIGYPIVIDNGYAIWRAFRNQYWPALYFIGADGRIRDRQFGEGEYDRCEGTIQQLLADARVSDVPDGLVSVEGTGVEAAADWSTLRSPEAYLGHPRTTGFVSRGGIRADRRAVYDAPPALGVNEWALTGAWTIGREAAVLEGAGGRIACGFHARDLHLVMRPSRADGPIRFRVTLDGQPPGPARGLDVDPDGWGTVGEPRLYQLIRQPGAIRGRLFTIEFLEAGAEAFAFTFG